MKNSLILMIVAATLGLTALVVAAPRTIPQLTGCSTAADCMKQGTATPCPQHADCLKECADCPKGKVPCQAQQ